MINLKCPVCVIIFHTMKYGLISFLPTYMHLISCLFHPRLWFMEYTVIGVSVGMFVVGCLILVSSHLSSEPTSRRVFNSFKKNRCAQGMNIFVRILRLRLFENFSFLLSDFVLEKCVICDTY